MPSTPLLIGGLSGAALAPFLVWLTSLFGAEMPAEAASSAGGLLVVLIAYFVPGGRHP